MLKDLIAAMGERRETPANFFNRYPLLSRLNGVSMQDLSSHSTLPNGNSATVTEPLFIDTDSAQPTAPVAEPQQEARVQVKRRASASSSVSSDVSSMSPARSPLDNFQISSLSPRQNVNPLASLEAYRTVGTDLSAGACGK
ncbi:hypothetical protein [Candidatus Symbiopectobacterium sp. 'North America']|uniref:hypothetical protein n=1 Tax=Candidatus Symbiopectobacterium sp. 'North America' TaxID=2794574 RepID=UPI0018C994A3|nr:hypothetical protein [Candidatus Symbiopectobacterium sp. 'North America']